MSTRTKDTLHDCLKNKNFMIGLLIIISVIIIAILAPYIAPYDYAKQNVGGRMAAPSASFSVLMSSDAMYFPGQSTARGSRFG